MVRVRMRVRGWVLWSVVLLVALGGGVVGVAAQQRGERAPAASVGAELRGLASRAGVVFVGQVEKIEPKDGVVEITFTVQQPVLGVVGGSYVMREWAGRWTGGCSGIGWASGRCSFCMRLRGANGMAGLSSPVDGMMGVVPVVPQARMAARCWMCAGWRRGWGGRWVRRWRVLDRSDRAGRWGRGDEELADGCGGRAEERSAAGGRVAAAGQRAGAGEGAGIAAAAGGGRWTALDGWRSASVAAGVALATATAWAGGPRFITGTSGYATAGVPMAWYTSQPMYFTDPGDLSSTVTHAQADAMVAAAAAVWNIPTASMTLAKGGVLAEHVVADGSDENAYFNGTSVVFPADVQATNYASVQIAVIYDSDGSVIDLLLGSGASDPSGCLQNGVVESVDRFGSSGTIQHAVIVLNGLCVGLGKPEQLTQMQYQLTRVFGRVLGLAWSQLNDDVFTGASQATAAEMALWPLMHPIDVICGSYTYQCMQNPFTLRPDDINALESLYPVVSSGGGKTQSSLNTVSVSGAVSFPQGQGMELVNVVAYRWILGQESGYEPYPAYSSTTGSLFQQNGGNPVSGPEPASENAGANTAADEGAWSMPYIAAGPQGASLYFRNRARSIRCTGGSMRWGRISVR